MIAKLSPRFTPADRKKVKLALKKTDAYRAMRWSEPMDQNDLRLESSDWAVWGKGAFYVYEDDSCIFLSPEELVVSDSTADLNYYLTGY